MRSIRAPLAFTATLLTLLCVVAPVAAAPTIAIEPASAARGAEVVVQLSGFAPGETIALRLTTSEATSRSLTIPTITIDTGGGYRLTIETVTLAPGDYTLASLRSNAVVASARFTVGAAPATPTRAPANSPRPTATSGPVPTTAAPVPTPPATGSGGNLPGLPNTGAGGGIDPGLICVALAAALLGALYALRSGRGRARRDTSDVEGPGGVR